MIVCLIKAPVNTQPLGELRPPDIMLQEFIYAFRCQGFELVKHGFATKPAAKVLRLKINNTIYREERLVRTRLNALLSALAPEDIEAIIVTIEVGTFRSKNCAMKRAFFVFTTIKKWAAMNSTPSHLGEKPASRTFMSPSCYSKKIWNGGTSKFCRRPTPCLEVQVVSSNMP